MDCPTQTITGQSPSSWISVSPTVTGCEGKCNWEVVEGTSGNTGSNYNTGSVTFYDANGSDTKTYTFKVTRSVFGQTATGQCTFKVSFNSSSNSEEFNCNSDNSYNLGTEVQRDLKAGECIKYTMGSASTLYVGSWYAPSRPVDITIKKCDGTLTTISHDKDNWIGVSVGSSCTIYLKPEKDIQLKLNNW